MFELFLTLEANDEQLDFPILYASGRGVADDRLEQRLERAFARFGIFRGVTAAARGIKGSNCS